MNQKTTLSYFYSSIIVSILALPVAYYLGGFKAIYIVAILSILEVSLSIDNAVVNAKVLQNWDEVWRQRFITWGMIIAVFGMRLVFPIVIVSFTTGMSSFDVLNLAAYEPDKYAAALKSVHHEVAAFGGAFLGMVALHFFLDANKDEHWLSWIEKPLTKLGQIQAIEMILILGLLYAVSKDMHEHEQLVVLLSGIAGLATYVAVKGFATLLGGGEEVGEHVIKQGVGGFIYLEVLDASFSFDGVIGAFALTNNLFIIMIGLGIGAFFVRSITILLVDRDTMAEYKYLEHGAFWAIAALAVFMIVGVIHEIPETVTGITGAVLIGLALWSSIKQNKKDVDAKSYA